LWSGRRGNEEAEIFAIRFERCFADEVLGFRNWILNQEDGLISIDDGLAKSSNGTTAVSRKWQQSAEGEQQCEKA
jgi:hypothetical protein